MISTSVLHVHPHLAKSLVGLFPEADEVPRPLLLKHGVDIFQLVTPNESSPLGTPTVASHIE